MNFDYWLSGFLAAEGSLISFINKSSNRMLTRASIKVRLDDEAILHRIQEHLGLGSVRQTKGRSRKLLGRDYYDGACSVWSAQSRKDCTAMADWLNRFPLYAKRSRDAALWCQIVRIIDANGSTLATPELLYLHNQLRDVKGNVPALEKVQ